MSRFFRQDNAFLRIMAVVACLPVVTIGASLTATHSVLWHMVRHEEGYVSREFIRSFRANLCQSTLGWLIILAAAIVLGGDALAVVWYGGSGLSRDVLVAIVILAGLVLAAVSQYFFVLVSRYENSLRGQFGNAAVIAVRNLPRTVAMLLVLGISYVVMIRYVVYAIPLILLPGVLLPQYICAWLYNPVLLRLDGAGPRRD